MSISSEISRLTQAKADIKTAIESKGVTVPSSAKLDDYPELIDDIEQGSTPNLQTKSVSITENGTTTVEPDPGYDGLSEVGVSVNVQGGGGGEIAKENDVNFIDYDGTILHSYTAEEFLSLTEMPENPTHEGLTSQGWNWTLEDAKDQVREMGDCVVGQMYITDDGKTRIDVEITKETRYVSVGVCPNGTVEVDWGDGGSTSSLSGTSLTTKRSVSHNYSTAGQYTITLSVQSGSFAFYGSSSLSYLVNSGSSSNVNASIVFLSCVKNVFIGESAVIGDYAFYYCTSLKYITLPNYIEKIGTFAFSSCYDLASCSVPINTTVLNSNSTFAKCFNLKALSVPYNLNALPNNYLAETYDVLTFIPKRIKRIGTSALSRLDKENIKIPNGVTTIDNNALSGNNRVKTVYIPDSVSSLGGTIFNSCYRLYSVRLPSNINKIPAYMFRYCYSLKSFDIPKTVTSIDSNAFQNCDSLLEITIPEGVTTIGSYAFQYCRCLSELVIPSTVTNIQNYAFGGCYGVSKYHFLSTTPPTLGGSYVFNDIQSNCKIYVPAESLQTYKTAQYWSTHASKMVGE
jgi:hypothetical protein